MIPTIVVASGYWDPIHSGHVRYLQAARKLGTMLWVVVNNDEQAALKKGRAFMKESERLEVVRALACVDHATLSVDDDRSVCRTLRLLHETAGGWGNVVFANGGDVSSEADCRESAMCRELGIEMVFGVGGQEKVSSSSELLRVYLSGVSGSK